MEPQIQEDGSYIIPMKPGFWGELKRSTKQYPYIQYGVCQLKTTRLVRMINDIRRRSGNNIHNVVQGRLTVSLYTGLLERNIAHNYRPYVEYLVEAGVLELYKDYSILSHKSRIYYVDITALYAVYDNIIKNCDSYILDEIKKDEKKVVAEITYTAKQARKLAKRRGASSEQITYVNNINKLVTQRYNVAVKGSTKHVPMHPWIKMNSNHNRLYASYANIPKEYRSSCFVDLDGTPMVEFDISYANTTLLAHNLGLTKLCSWLLHNDIYIAVGSTATDGQHNSVLLNVLQSLHDAGDLDDQELDLLYSYGYQLDEDTDQLIAPATNDSPEWDTALLRTIGKLLVNAGLNQKSKSRINNYLSVVVQTITARVDKDEAQRIKDWHKEVSNIKVGKKDVDPIFRQLVAWEWQVIEEEVGNALADVGIHYLPIHDGFFVDAKDADIVREVLNRVHQDGGLSIHPDLIACKSTVAETETVAEPETVAETETDALEADLGVDMTTDTWMQRESILDASSWQQTGISDDTPRPDTPDKINNNQDQLLDLLRSRLTSSSRDLN